MINFIKATDLEFDKVINSRIEMLKVVNNLSDDAVFDEDFINRTKEYFRSPYQTTILSVDNNEVIGCATICYIKVMPTFDHPSGKRAHIMNVYTRKNNRRQGIAFQMMKMLIEEAKQRGVSEISLDATELGRQLYKKCGFLESKEGMVLNIKSH
ncbi:MAG TPA: GNAT family N-acetyltransferase [Oscillospiraceae bacterium]|nr:GNAT family N-acetyltransferase [Oscillospiraceae bacterium]